MSSGLFWITDALPDENTMRLVSNRMNVKFVSYFRAQIRRKLFTSGSKPYANGFRLIMRFR